MASVTHGGQAEKNTQTQLMMMQQRSAATAGCSAGAPVCARARCTLVVHPRALRSVHCQASSTSVASSCCACAIAATLLASAAPAVGEDLTPYQLQDKIEFGVLSSSMTLRACPSNINPNCVSTASTNDTYGPAFRANEADPARAVRVLEDAVFDLFGLDGARVLDAQHLQDGIEYVRFGVDSSFGQDILEFLIKPEGKGTEGALVTYRSLAGSVRYVWPIQQPIGDFDAQRKRLTALRERTGWSVIGCELIECYYQ